VLIKESPSSILNWSSAKQSQQLIVNNESLIADRQDEGYTAFQAAGEHSLKHTQTEEAEV
jgi:hypothetical protein